MATDSDIAGFASLGLHVNKQRGDNPDEREEGVASEKLPELTLDMSDEDIVALTEKWEKEWNDSPKRGEWLKQIDENEKYWLGKHHDLPQTVHRHPNVDNLIFESLETYLPQMTRRNPEPLVLLRATEEEAPANLAYVEKIKGRLADLADELKIRLKLKKAGRFWALYLLGVAKFGYNLDSGIPSVSILRPQRVILDPDAFNDEDGYTGNRIGEYRKLQASVLKAIIGDDIKHTVKKLIDEKTDDNDATWIRFIEWWTPEYFCWTLDNHVLFKRKNPHWNYDEDMDVLDEVGEVSGQETREGINHFPVPRMPYVFLTVFNLGDQPMDNTSLIGQNLSVQDQINKRNKQIEDNVDDMNGGIVVSLARAGLTSNQAKNVALTLRKKGSVAIPDGAPREAIERYPAPGLPADVFNDLLDKRSRLRDLFGVKGSSQAGLESERTVRGKIVSRMMDTDRIGGGVSEYLEQFADDIYNWLVQLLYVYDDAFQFVEGAKPPRLIVSVKEGSLLPQDSITLANQAIELALAGKLSLVDLFKKLEYPNPEELAANVWLEANAPHLLYGDNPNVMEALGAQQTQEQAGQLAGAGPQAVEGALPQVPQQTPPAPEEVISQGL